jgi:nuclear pore complex protein Nup155
MPLNKLEEVISEYRRLHYAKGAIELPLRCAQEWDTDNSGYDHWLSGSPANDPRVEVYNLRHSCYELILAALDFFDGLRDQAHDPGNREVSDDSLLISQSAFRSAIKSGDAAFHSAFYEWLIERGSADELLEVMKVFSLQL